MDRSRKLAALRRVLGPVQIDRIASKGEAVFVCPRPGCRKDRAKLSVNLDVDTFHCWICGFGARSLFPLLRLRPSADDIAEYAASRGDRALAEERRRAAEERKSYDAVELPVGFRPLLMGGFGPYHAAAVAYLERRGATVDDVARLKIGYCEDGEYANMVVFPSFDADGELNFVIGRSFFDGAARRHMHGNYSKDIVFNEYLVDWTRPVTVVEGLFDALVAGENAVPILGTAMGNCRRLFSRVIAAGVDVYFALDADAVRKQIRMVAELVSYGVRCWTVPLAGAKDVGSMTKEQYAEARAAASPCDDAIGITRLKLADAATR